MGSDHGAGRTSTIIERQFNRRAANRVSHAAPQDVLLYDEPTAGLDPMTATTMDEEIIKRCEIASVSSIIYTSPRFSWVRDF